MDLLSIDALAYQSQFRAYMFLQFRFRGWGVSCKFLVFLFFELKR